MEAMTKPFDAVRMKWQGAKKVQEQIAGMSLEEELRFWQEGTEELLALQDRLRRARDEQRSEEHERTRKSCPPSAT
jgi:hypothetical protein